MSRKGRWGQARWDKVRWGEVRCKVWSICVYIRCDSSHMDSLNWFEDKIYDRACISCFFSPMGLIWILFPHGDLKLLHKCILVCLPASMWIILSIIRYTCFSLPSIFYHKWVFSSYVLLSIICFIISHFPWTSSYIWTSLGSHHRKYIVCLSTVYL